MVIYPIRHPGERHRLRFRQPDAVEYGDAEAAGGVGKPRDVRCVINRLRNQKMGPGVHLAPGQPGRGGNARAQVNRGADAEIGRRPQGAAPVVNPVVQARDGGNQFRSAIVVDGGGVIGRRKGVAGHGDDIFQAQRLRPQQQGFQGQPVHIPGRQRKDGLSGIAFPQRRRHCHRVDADGPARVVGRRDEVGRRRRGGVIRPPGTGRGVIADKCRTAGGRAATVAYFHRRL